MGIGEQPGDTREAAERDAGTLDHAMQGTIPLEGWFGRQSMGHEGETGFVDKGDGIFCAGGTSFHN